MKISRLLEIAAALLLAAGGAGVLAVRPLDDRLDAMLPQDPGLLQSMRVLEDAKLSGRVILHVVAADSAFPHGAFVAAMDRLVAELPSPLVSRIVVPATSMPSPDDMRELAKFAPQLLGPETYVDLERRLGDEDIVRSLAAIRRTMMSPHSIPMADWFRRDPLGARATALKPFESLGKAAGFRVNIVDGHFFDEEQRAAMLIVETPVRVTDHAGSVRLVEHLRAGLARLPDGLSGSILAAHLHTLSNQRILRRDINRTWTLATLFFGGLLWVYYRDLRSAIIFAIPLFGILMGLAVVGLTGVRVAAIVLGMCSVLAGLAIDYGIHVYVALKHPETDRSREEAIRLIRPTLWLSALTTLVPVAVLGLSAIPGYRQLGLLAGSALFFSLLLALRVLPLFFPRDLKAAPVRRAPAALHRAPSPQWVVGLFCAGLVAAIVAAAGIRVDLNLARLDGTEAEVLRDEEAFVARWGAGPDAMGIVAAWDSNPEIARQANDAIYRQVSAMDELSGAFVSLSPAIPSEKTRRANAALWTGFWELHGEDVREKLDRIAPRHGFAERAFDPFFETLSDGTDPVLFPATNRLLAALEQPFAHAGEDRFLLLSYYPDTPAANQALANLRDIPAAYALVSRRGLQAAFSSTVLRDLARQSSLALTLVVILVAVFVRRPAAMLLVAVPPFAGVVGMLAGLRLAGQPLTPVAMLAGFLVVGNSIDYGAFMLEAWRRGVRDEISRGVHLAWLTTAGGASLLLVTRHPVLFSTGLALALGITCGYIAARWALPSLAQILRVPSARTEGAA
jgi:predicted exporter